jgi:hypothetical protein
VLLEELHQLKNLITLLEFEHVACSVVPQPTTLLHPPPQSTDRNNRKNYKIENRENF